MPRVPGDGRARHAGGLPVRTLQLLQPRYKYAFNFRSLEMSAHRVVTVTFLCHPFLPTANFSHPIGHFASHCFRVGGPCKLLTSLRL